MKYLSIFSTSDDQIKMFTSGIPTSRYIIVNTCDIIFDFLLKHIIALLFILV